MPIVVRMHGQRVALIQPFLLCVLQHFAEKSPDQLKMSQNCLDSSSRTAVCVNSAVLLEACGCFRQFLARTIVPQRNEKQSHTEQRLSHVQYKGHDLAHVCSQLQYTHSENGIPATWHSAIHSRALSLRIHCLQLERRLLTYACACWYVCLAHTQPIYPPHHALGTCIP